MACFIVGMGLVFAFVTQIVLRDTLHLMAELGMKKEFEEWSSRFIGYYESNENSIPAIDRLALGEYGIQAPVLSKDELAR